MVTYFNKKDMVSFAQWILSDERQALRAEDVIQPPEGGLAQVHLADFESWMMRQKK